MTKNAEGMPSDGAVLPGLDCGLCGCQTCAEFAARLVHAPDLIKRCTPNVTHGRSPSATAPAEQTRSHPFALPLELRRREPAASARPARETAWQDSLGRPFDFFLEHFPEDPGPREVILPHNPLMTREMDIQIGDVLIGRPLGMSCGCPVTHCGVATQVDRRTGVIVWCVTGPLQPRARGYKDLGYYSAEAYEGLIRETRTDVSIGVRYFFQPRMCMLQWRHSGLVNFLNRIDGGMQVRLEGLWIG